MTSAVDASNIVFGANFHDDGTFDASLNTTISSTFSFGDSDGNVDCDGDLTSVNCSSLFSSPDFTFKTPKKIMEEERVENCGDDAHVDLDREGNGNKNDSKTRGPFHSPKDGKINDIAARFSSCIGISSNLEGTKLLKKSAKKPSRADENDRDTKRNIQTYEDVIFLPFKHNVTKDSSRGPGAWFWGDGAGVDASSKPASENSFAQA